MLVIDTYLAADKYGGRGVFARSPIKKGDIVWQYSDASTRMFTLEDYKVILARGGCVADTMKTYCYPAMVNSEPLVFHDMDNGSFMNHDDNPNTGYMTDPSHPQFEKAGEVNIALRDIAAGEELTFNYFDFVDDLSPWRGIETCMQFLFDMGRFEKKPLKTAA